MMKPRYAIALTCAYFLGWALVLAGMMMGGHYDKPVFVAIEQIEDRFFKAALDAWICFSLPCLFIAIALYRELKSSQKASDTAHSTK
jgi:hypothetical protein